jgi:ATP-binding cassette subfamily B protein
VLRSGQRPAQDVPRSAIRFEQVSFAYPGSDRQVLDQVDLELPAGTSTAIVGLNGAGKTTVTGPRT